MLSSEFKHTTLLFPPHCSCFLSSVENSFRSITEMKVFPPLVPRQTMVFLCRAASRSSTYNFSSQFDYLQVCSSQSEKNLDGKPGSLYISSASPSYSDQSSDCTRPGNFICTNTTYVSNSFINTHTHTLSFSLSLSCKLKQLNKVYRYYENAKRKYQDSGPAH